MPLYSNRSDQGKNKPWSQYSLSFLLGAVMPFAFSPYDHAWLAVLALGCWVFLLMRSHAFVTGWAFGLGWFGVGGWWLAPTFHEFAPMPYTLAVLPVVLLGSVLALFPAVWAWGCAKLVKKQPNWIWVIFPVFAVAEEWLRGHLFSGLPWTSLGNLLLDTPAIGWVAWVGVYGAALIPAGCAASLALLLQSRRGAGILGLVAMLLLIALAPAPFQATGAPQTVALVQANIPQKMKWDAGFLRETMNRYVNLSSQAAKKSTLIIWPEAAIPMFLSQAPGWDRWLREQMQSWNTTVLFGGLKLAADGHQAQNGLYLSIPDTQQRQFAGKHHLVPFGEYVPSWIPFLHTLVPSIADFRPSNATHEVLHERENRYGSLICYEAIFPEEARQRVREGANVLINVTNDAWYGHTPAGWQHFQAARMRAVETGRYLLRAANTGVTAIIAPDGHIEQRIPWFTQTVLYGQYRPSSTITPYTQRGDWPLLLLGIPVLFLMWKRKQP